MKERFGKTFLFLAAALFGAAFLYEWCCCPADEAVIETIKAMGGISLLISLGFIE